MGTVSKPNHSRRDRPVRRAIGTPVLVAAGDRATVGYVRAALDAVGIESKSIGRQEAVLAGAKALLLVPGTSLASHRVAEALDVLGRGGAVYCWSVGRLDPAAGDSWIAGQILLQHGAVVSPRLAVLAIAARLRRFLDGVGNLSGGVKCKGSRSGIRTRLEQSLDQAGVPFAAGAKACFEISVLATGKVGIKPRRGSIEPVGSIEDTAEALALLFGGGGHEEGLTAAPKVDRETVGQIVRPPRRVLSEAASKRLLFAVGIQSPAERLCKSASEAARFAGEVDGPVVLKLVRPGFERKNAAGAVLLGVVGAAAVRRGYHELVGLGEKMGPPPALGVLVASSVDGGGRIWCTARRHPGLGWVLLLGSGDDPSADTRYALSLPLGSGQARRVLGGLLEGAKGETLASLGRALVRIGALIEACGDLLELVEVHPLVAPVGGGETIAVDALVAIGGGGRSESD